MGIIEYTNEEVKICISCNIVFMGTGLFTIKYGYCPYCQSTLWKVSELIEHVEE